MSIVPNSEIGGLGKGESSYIKPKNTGSIFMGVNIPPTEYL